jgi:hypothetical protein
MRFDQPILTAVSAVRDLSKRLDQDFDVDDGGFTWWKNYELALETKTGIMDYLYGLVATVSQNLQDAALHLADLTDLRAEDDQWLNARRRAGRPSLRGEAEQRRAASIEVHRVGVLRAVGSTLDTLAGVVVGGFHADLVMADLGLFQPLVPGADYPGPDVRGKLKLPATVLDTNDPQGNLLRATRSSLLAAGPSGWLNWTLWSRNDLVHRSTRSLFMLLVNDDTLARPMPRQPKYSEVHAMRTGNTYEDVHLTQDALVTLSGVLESVNAAVVGTMMACTGLWDERRAHPDTITQPAIQWKTGANPPATDFVGYRPGSANSPDNGVIVTNPDTARRWKASKILKPPVTSTESEAM